MVFVTLGLFYFNQKNITIESQNTVVETEIKKENTEEAIPTVQNNQVVVSNENKSINNVIPSRSSRAQSRDEKNQPKINSNETAIINQNQEEAIVNQEVVFPNSKLKIDVDELLASVENDRKKETKINKSTINVDAKNLLSEVDTELDMSFRERVLNTVNKNYKSVKEAVANRNH